MPLPLTEARRYADKAIEIAAARSLRVGVVVVDELGLLVQMDRMDGAPLMAPDVAEAIKALERSRRRIVPQFDCRVAACAPVPNNAGWRPVWPRKQLWPSRRTRGKRNT